jgi:hypothetical protein
MGKKTEVGGPLSEKKGLFNLKLRKRVRRKRGRDRLGIVVQ